MRVLLFTGSASRYMAPPRLSPEQIVAGPDWPDEQDAAGRCLSLKTPLGEYSITPLLARLPADQQPEVLVCLVDAARRSLPRHLASFRGPKVLLVADTHHLQSPLLGMLRYAGAEPFDRIVFLYDRHHAPLFRDAGLPNLFWFPGLTFPHADTAVAAISPPARPLAQLAFVGQAGKFHPRRARLLAALQAARVPVQLRQVPQSEALAFYATSQIGFNASLNADLNLRIFEIFASGALLLTDALAPASGLEHLRSLGCEFCTYASERELTRYAQHWLDHPAAAAAAGARARHWLLATFHETNRQRWFRELAFDGRAPEPFPIFDTSTPRFTFADRHQLLTATAIYERLQELHRDQEIVRVASIPPHLAAFDTLARTLPRLTHHDDPAASDLTLCRRHDLSTCDQLSDAKRLWCWDVPPTDLPEITAPLVQAGFAPQSSSFALFAKAANLQQIVDAAAATLRSGGTEVAAAAVQAVLTLDPRFLPALLLAGEMAVLFDDASLATDIRTELRRLASDDPEAKTMDSTLTGLIGGSALKKLLARSQAAFKNQNLREALACAKEAGDYGSDSPEALLILARCLLLSERWSEAEKTLHRAQVLAPHDPAILAQRANTLRHLGRLAEALDLSLRAAQFSPEDPEPLRKIVDAALALSLRDLALSSLEKLARHGSAPECEALRTRANHLPVIPPTQEFDLLVLHVEPSRLHGTGVLLQRFFPDHRNLVTLRSRSHYEGKTEMGGLHLVIDQPGLSETQRESRLRALLSGRRIRRILCVPYFTEDFQNAVLAKKITGTPLCAYVMDYQTAYANSVPAATAARLFAQADLRLVISPEMRDAYAARFRCSFGVLPPIVPSLAGRHENRWRPDPSCPPRAALVGNIWSPRQFAQLRQFTRELGLQLDWFGNAKVHWLPSDPQEYARDGIVARGFLPEPELARRLADYPFVVVPSGQLDGTETNEWLTRLSLPSRMIFITAQTLTPMLVLGHPATAAAGFVSRHGLGLVTPYDPSAAQAAVARLLEPLSRADFIANARRVAAAHVMPEAGDWIWRSLAARTPLPCPLDELETEAAQPLAS